METHEEVIRNFIAKGTTQEAIDFYIQKAIKGSTLDDELHLLSSRMARCAEQFSKDIATREVTKVEENSIIMRLLQLLKDENIPKQEIPLKPGIEQKILMICRTENDRLTLGEFLKIFKFRNIKTVVALSYAELEQKAGKGFVIAIWDNRDLKACQEEETLIETGFGSLNATKIEQRVEFMKDCLCNDVASYYLHYGEPLFLVSEKRDWIYSANSRFALIGRLKEMLDYIKAYGG